MRKVNPFKPTAGAEPPILAGRDAVLDDFEIGLEEGVGAPGRLMRITGPRGSGKTVFLTELGDIARQRGWRVADVTAAEHLPQLICRRLEKADSVDYSVELDLMVVKAKAQKDEPQGPEDIYEALDRVAGKLAEKGKGLHVTIDEIQDASAGDVREIAAAIQHLIREHCNIAFVFAGLTAGVMNLLGEDGPTFLRRAYLEELDTIPVSEVETTLGATFEKNGVLIDEDVLATAADSTAGYAYLIQLVSYNVWRAAQVRAGMEFEPSQRRMSRRALSPRGGSSNGRHSKRQLPAFQKRPGLMLVKQGSGRPTRGAPAPLGYNYPRSSYRKCVQEPLGRAT